MTILLIILVLLMLFMLFSGIGFFVYGVKESEVSGIAFGMFLILLVILPTSYWIYDNHQKEKCIVTSEYVNATVENKTHRAPYTTFISSGKVTTPIYHAEEWNVKLKYNDIENVIDSKALYDDVEEKEKIKSKLTTYTFKNGSIYKKELTVEGIN